MLISQGRSWPSELGSIHGKEPKTRDTCTGATIELVSRSVGVVDSCPDKP